MIRVLVLFFLAPAAFAAPKIDNLSVKANTKSPEVEIAVAVTKNGGSCDVRVDFGDGRGRTIDFGMATTRTLKYTYAKGGSYRVSVKGAGKSPCEGAKEVALSVAVTAAEKKAVEKKKAAKKKSAAKKKDEKS